LGIYHKLVSTEENTKHSLQQVAQPHTLLTSRRKTHCQYSFNNDIKKQSNWPAYPCLQHIW